MPFSRGPPEAPSTRRLKSRRPKYLINRRNRVAAFARAAAALDVFEAIVATPVRPGDLRVAARSVLKAGSHDLIAMDPRPTSTAPITVP